MCRGRIPVSGGASCCMLARRYEDHLLHRFAYMKSEIPVGDDLLPRMGA